MPRHATTQTLDQMTDDAMRPIVALEAARLVDQFDAWQAEGGPSAGFDPFQWIGAAVWALKELTRP